MADTISSASPRPYSVRVAALILVLFGVAAYANSFWGAFVFDDVGDLVNNDRLHHLGSSVRLVKGSWRPVIFLTFAANYKMGGPHEGGYHAVNLAIHILAALTLFGLVRRTLLLEPYRERFRESGPWIAFVAALIWLVHPLQTESVTYIVQRYESAMGLFYLLTLYCLLRGSQSERRSLGWYSGAVLACLLGMGSKEVMVTAPLVALIFDRVFLADSWRVLVRRRWLLYGALFAAGIVLYIPVRAALGNDVQYVGFGNEQRKPYLYLLNETEVILYYLRLAIWPDPLCLDYAWPMTRHVGALILPFLVVTALFAACLWQFRRRPWLGFLGIAFFFILAPTSSFVPMADPAVEHRMYLPLAAVVVCQTVGGAEILRWCSRRYQWSDRQRVGITCAVVGVIVTIFTSLTVLRNMTYFDEELIWRDTVEKRPRNDYAIRALATLSLRRGRSDEALALFQRAAKLRPNEPATFRGLGRAYMSQGNVAQAIQNFQGALALEPDADSYQDLARLLLQSGKDQDAVEVASAGIRHFPQNAKLHLLLGAAYSHQGRGEEALAALQAALQLAPGSPNTQLALAQELLRQGKSEEAMGCLQECTRRNPEFAPAYNSIGLIHFDQGNSAQSVAAFGRAAKLRQDYPAYRLNLATALFELGNVAGAQEQYVVASRLSPNWMEDVMRMASGMLSSPKLGRDDKATVLRLAKHACYCTNNQQPRYLQVLAAAYAETGDFEKAAAVQQTAIGFLAPSSAEEISGAKERLATFKSGQPYRKPLEAAVKSPGGQK
jgi:tetratricopeptide (TPR) repeat protein